MLNKPWLWSILAAASFCAVAAEGPPAAKPWAPTTPVVGPLAVGDFPARLPAWEERARAWRPTDAVIERLKAARQARIEVVFGSWCQDSFDHIPPLVAALRAAANPDLELVLTGVDRKKQDPTGAAARLGVVRVPTVVVFRSGAELGRVIETPAATMDEDVARILQAVLGDAPVREKPFAPPRKENP